MIDKLAEVGIHGRDVGVAVRGELVGIGHGPAQPLQLLDGLRALRQQVGALLLELQEHEVEVVEVDRRCDGKCQRDVGTGLGECTSSLADLVGVRHAAMGQTGHGTLLRVGG